MKNILLAVGLLLSLACLSNADNGVYSYARVTRTATTVSASTWTLLNGTTSQGLFDPSCKHIKIAEDTRNFDIYVALAPLDLNTNTSWLQKALDGPFDEPMSLNPDYGVYVYVSGACTIRLKTEK